jgi:hypothetical protein
LQRTLDAEDALLAPIFSIATAASVNIANVSLFGASLQDTAFMLGAEAIPVGTVVAALAFVTAYVTNDGADLGRLDDEYRYAVMATAGMIVAIPVIPSVLDFITSSDFMSLAVVAIQSAGFAAVSWMA